MKTLLILLLAVVLISGCINFGGSKATFGLSEVTSNPDLYLKIQTSSDTIKSERYVQMEFVIENKGEAPLTNVKITAYDQCMFTGESVKEIDEIRPNRSSQWNWKWQASEVEFDRDCTVGFRTTYDTYTTSAITTNVLSESEYYTREEEGKLNEITSSESSTANSLRINMGFSEPQPWLDDEKIFVYVDYNDVGGGLLKELEKTNVTIIVTPNLADGECSSYETDSVNPNKFILDNPLKFISKSAPSTTCAFTTNATQPIESGSITITANYKYQFDNSLLLKVTPK